MLFSVYKAQRYITFTQNAMARRTIRSIAILFAFMVVLFGIDVPDGRLVGFPEQGADGLDGAEHGVVHVVVAVLAVSANAIKIGKAIQPFTNLAEFGVASEIGRICFGHFNADTLVDGGVFAEDADLMKLFYRHLDECLVIHRPEIVPFGTEVFQPDPDMLCHVVDHVWRPIVENLDPSDPHLSFLNVYPRIGHDVVDGFDFRRILEGKLVHKKPDRDEITIGEVGGDAFHIAWRRSGCRN